MSFPRKIHLSLILLASLYVADGSADMLSADIQTYAQACCGFEQVFGDESAFAEVSSSVGSATGLGRATKNGVMKVLASATATRGRMFSHGQVNYRDNFIVTSDTINFSGGYFDVAIKIDGNVSYSATSNQTGGSWAVGYGSIFAEIRGDGVSKVQEYEFGSPKNGNGQYFQGLTSGSEDGSFEISITAIPWQDYSLGSINIWVNANANVSHVGSSGTSTVTTDLSNTVTWGGITQVYDENLNPIDPSEIQLSLLNASGYDYAQAAVVPLPAPFVLMLSALLMIVKAPIRRVE